MSQSSSKIYEGPKFTIIFLIIILSIPCFLLIDRMELPGIGNEDSRWVVASQQLLENVNPHPENSVTFFDQVFLVGNFYNGSPSIYFTSVPMTFLLGPSLVTERLMGIILLVVTTIFVYLFGKELFNQKIGLVSASFFAFTPSTFFFTKYPTTGDPILFFFLVALLYFLIKWKNTKKTPYLAGAFLLLGLGFDEKVLFIWVFIALFFALIIFKPKLEYKIKNYLIMGIFTLVGATLFFVRWTIHFDKYLFQINQKVFDTGKGHTNTEIFQNLYSRFEHTFELLNGGFLSTAFGGYYTNETFAIFFFISVAGIFITKAFNLNQYFRRSAFMILIFFVILAVSIFSFTTFNISSLIILLPISSIIMAVFLVNITEILPKQKNSKVVSHLALFGVLIFLFTGNFILIDNYKAEAELTGGTIKYTVLYAEAGKYLLEQNYSKVMNLDLYFYTAIALSTENKIEVIDNPMYNNQIAMAEEFKTIFRNSLNDPEMVYFKTDEDLIQEKRKNWHIVNKILEEENKQFILLKTFENSQEQKLMFLYKAIDKQ